MRKKWFYISGLVLLTIVISMVFTTWSEEESEVLSNRSASHTLQANKGSSQVGTIERVGRVRPSRELRAKQLQFNAQPLSDAPEESKEIEYPKYRAFGSGTRGAIRDMEGNVIWRATDETPVYSATISPSDGRIVVGAGNGNAYVITNGGKKIADLPQFPPGKDMLGLGNWVWLDNNRLLGESGVQTFAETGEPVGCCQGHNMSESRFYVYDLQNNQMHEMQLPENLQGKVLTIGKVLKTGEIQLGHEGDEFSWYQVTGVGKENR